MGGRYHLWILGFGSGPMNESPHTHTCFLRGQILDDSGVRSHSLLIYFTTLH